jgi:hypothetical protein
MEQSIPEKRFTRRSNVLLTGTIEWHGKLLPVTLRNLSAEGALASGDQLPRAGSKIRFQRNELTADCTVMWVHAHHAGLKFNRPLPKSVVLKHRPEPPRPQVASSPARPGFSRRVLTEEEKRVLEEWDCASATRLGA